jgi:hypothetical protein
MRTFKGATIDKQAAADWPTIQREAAKHPRFVIEVREYNEAAEISLKQMAYFHAVVVPLFVKEFGDSPQYWENKLKIECGSKWFMPELIKIGGNLFVTIPSKKKLKVSDFCEWYQNISDLGLSINCIVPPPDPEWRQKGEKWQTLIR